MIVQQPLALIDSMDAFDIKVTVHGGGESVRRSGSPWSD